MNPHADALRTSGLGHVTTSGRTPPRCMRESQSARVGIIEVHMDIFFARVVHCDPASVAPQWPHTSSAVVRDVFGQPGTSAVTMGERLRTASAESPIPLKLRNIP